MNKSKLVWVPMDPMSDTPGHFDVGIDTDDLPLADCGFCEYMAIKGHGGEHCYMFKTKPGKYCGQFKREKDL